MSVERLEEVVNIYANVPHISSLENIPVRVESVNKSLKALTDSKCTVEDRITGDFHEWQGAKIITCSNVEMFFALLNILKSLACLNF